MGCFVSKEAKLLEAVKSGDVAAARAALERGASVVCSEGVDCTLLHEAASNGHLDIATLLLEKGANLEAKNNDGQTPLDVAADEAMRELLPSPPAQRIEVLAKWESDKKAAEMELERLTAQLTGEWNSMYGTR